MAKVAYYQAPIGQNTWYCTKLRRQTPCHLAAAGQYRTRLAAN